MSRCLIVLKPRQCPNCKTQTNFKSEDYLCPFCGLGFCSQCYSIDTDGPGNYVLCPNCKKRLFFPKKN